MIPNLSRGLYVKAGSHSYPVHAWSDDGAPLIALSDGLVEPPFPNWTLEDPGIVKEDTEEQRYLMERLEQLEKSTGPRTDIRNEIICGDGLKALDMVERAERDDREVYLKHRNNWPGLS